VCLRQEGFKVSLSELFVYVTSQEMWTCSTSHSACIALRTTVLRAHAHSDLVQV
jgi:hypothetical protein